MKNDPSNLSRRDILKLGGSAALALSIGKTQSVAAANKKIRIGIVGGRFGASFQFHEHPDCIVEAVSDLRPERRDHLMKTYRCTKSYPSLEELVLDPDIDAVGLFTDAPLHVDHAILAMKNGKHVLSAVPACVGSIEDAERLLAAVKKTGLTYMMAETSYYQQPTISARNFYKSGNFGDLYYAQAYYQHSGLESLYFENGKRTWRYGFAPMHYPTHTTALLIGVTGERLTEVVCHGYGDDDPILKDNAYNNPFWNCTAQFKTDRDHAFQCYVWWKGAHRGTERGEWVGTDMSFYGPHQNGIGPTIVRSEEGLKEKDDAGFERNLSPFEQYKQPEWWKTDLLPEPLRHNSGHHGSHCFLTHEFIDALMHDRKPTVDIYEALAYTVPGIIAHESALRGGELMKVPQYDPA
ncbi:MAG: Gfo/Idh/MocA family oxidoreductase [Candidatus Hydrogenedentota bacterium]